MLAESPPSRWRTPYIVTVVYGVLTLVALWLFSRAYHF